MHHQSVYFPASLLSETPYNSAFALSGDYDLLARLYLKKSPFLYIDQPLSVFDTSGSTFDCKKQEIGARESMHIKQRLFGQAPFLTRLQASYFYTLNLIRRNYSIYQMLELTYHNSSMLLSSFSAKILKILYLFKLASPSLISLMVPPGIEHLDMLRFLHGRGVDLVIDVGANRGQFFLACCLSLSKFRYLGFEPIPIIFSTLHKVVNASNSRTSAAKIFQIVLSNSQKSVDFFVTRKSDCSSYLHPSPNLSSFSKYMALADSEPIPLEAHQLDEYATELSNANSVLLKIDVQGAELDVLRGSNTILQNENLHWIYCEISETEHYRGQCMFGQVCDFLRDANFLLHSLYNVNRRLDGSLLYGDALFARSV
jgi:FkbM family methyltransferase